MPDYSKGRIYTIRCRSNDALIYVGCTTQTLSARFAEHKRTKGVSLYKYVNNPENNTVWDDWYIELYENFPCIHREELTKREGEVIRDIATINIRGYITAEIIKQKAKLYRDSNKDKIKDYYVNHKEYFANKAKENRNKNIDQRKEKEKEWKDKNKQTISDKKREAYKKNRDLNHDTVRQKEQAYREANREHIRYMANKRRASKKSLETI